MARNRLEAKGGLAVQRPYKLLHRVADSHVLAFRTTYVQSVRRARTRVTNDQINNVIANHGVMGRMLDVFDDVVVAKGPVDDAAGAYAKILMQAIQTMGPYDASLYGDEVNSIVASLSVTSPFVARQAQSMAADLVSKVSLESKAAIRQAVTMAVRGELAPDALRGLIREVIGLNGQQATALTNYRIGLGDEPKAESLTQRYSETLLSQRADTIARTETMDAANTGQQLLWKEMADQGIVDRATFLQVWLVTDDELLCDDCAPMADDTASLDGAFTQDEKGVLESDRVPYAGDTVDSPPLHPNCRCTLVSGP